MGKHLFQMARCAGFHPFEFEKKVHVVPPSEITIFLVVQKEGFKATFLSRPTEAGALANFPAPIPHQLSSSIAL